MKSPACSNKCCMKDFNFGKIKNFKTKILVNAAETTKNVMRKHKFLVDTEGTCASKTFDDTIPNH